MHDVVVVYTLVKNFLRVLRVLKGSRGLRVLRVLRILTVLRVSRVCTGFEVCTVFLRIEDLYYL